MAELSEVQILVAPLPLPIEFMRFCYACEGEHAFVLEQICASGHVGRCLNCGDERIVPFTRTTMEEE